MSERHGYERHVDERHIPEKQAYERHAHEKQAYEESGRSVYYSRITSLSNELSSYHPTQ
jgi:hypothetical protein